MIPELGHFLLIIAAMTALLAPAVVFYGIRRGDDFYAGFSRPASLLTALMLTLSTAALVWAFLTDDFSVAYVANHSNTKLAPAYKAAALWGSHEGSMLLWIWLMAVGTAGAGFVRCADRLFTARLQGLMRCSRASARSCSSRRIRSCATCRWCRPTVVTSIPSCRTSA